MKIRHNREKLAEIEHKKMMRRVKMKAFGEIRASWW